MEASHISLAEKKVKAIVEKLARGRALKKPPICIFYGRNLGISHLKHSCGNMPLKIRRPNIYAQKVHGEDVSEVIKVSAYQCNSTNFKAKRCQGAGTMLKRKRTRIWKQQTVK